MQQQSPMTPYDIFRYQLALKYPSYGHALWDPNPGALEPRVQVGDVGFIREGKFHRLFSAMLPENHPSHSRLGVPEYHEQLTSVLPVQDDPFDEYLDLWFLHPNDFLSGGVTNVSNTQPIAAGSIGSREAAYSCTKKQGAVLSLPVRARSEDALTPDYFYHWIIWKIDSWFAFTQQLDLQLKMEDIVLVTGFDRAKSWANIVFNNVQPDSQSSLGVTVAGSFCSDINWQAPSPCPGAVLSHRPNGENLEDDQCIFIRGYRVKRVFFGLIPRLRGAAEPKPDPCNDPEPEMEAVLTSSVTEYQDPLHILLEYIAKCAPHDCDMVLVHDEDLEQILRVGDGRSLPVENLQSDEMMDFFERSKPEIGVTSASFPANDQSPRVAMLSSRLTSPKSGPPSLRSATY